jgi:hypothetical protein
MVFNWHDTDDEGDHNAVETLIFILTEGGNSSLADNVRVLWCSGLIQRVHTDERQSTEQYVIEALAVQLNHTHSAQNASSTPWVAIFPCTRDSSAGNSSELTANAARLGARAILVRVLACSWTVYRAEVTRRTPRA